MSSRKPAKPDPRALLEARSDQVSGPVPIERSRAKPAPIAFGKSQLARVLLIDDSELARMAVADTLLRVGCQVYQLASPIGATGLILRHNLKAAIIDVSAPGSGSDKMVAMLRSNLRLRDLAIILISGNPDVDLEATRAATGANGALDKSRIEAELWPMLARVLGGSLDRSGK